MPYVAVLILLLVAGTFVVYDIGRLVNARIQFQNATDAAALAGVAIKINKHHVDTLVRAAMTQEAIIAQAEIATAQSIALQAFLKGSSTMSVQPLNPDTGQPVGPNPILGDMKEYSTRYKVHANRAYKHAVKFHRERLALEAYYRWLEHNGPTAVREAARVGFLANIQGYDDLGDPSLVDNVEAVLNRDEDMLENRREFSIPPLYGFKYSEDAASEAGMFGKSFAEIKANGIATKSGAALLRYFETFQLNSAAAAQIVNRPDRNSLGPLSAYTMQWYSPHLMAIEKDPQEVGH